MLTTAGPDVAGQVRYRFHDLVRLYARERAEIEDAAAERAEARSRGFGAWLAIAERMAVHIPGPCYAPIGGIAPRTTVDFPAEEIDPLLWFDAERAALAATVRQACGLGLDEVAFDLAGRLEKYFDVRGMYAEWHATNTQVIEVCRRHGNLLGEAVMRRGLSRATGRRPTAFPSSVGSGIYRVVMPVRRGARAHR
ncbi:hypothetical protein KZZ52_15805 [Dactylosporangium sp. AC04546]|uniref:hypothetical protein n=1 Tax=Dactylosporangium sp. AC04546 TaxID=2862460 RepID=UPI002E7BBA41|nr:hypothetical protein [Dactylosporangium sp. AC04546]WVK86771.1 hypothetical protein KZZ52_15805 [Dactylosporangium sp. AC04546]